MNKILFTERSLLVIFFFLCCQVTLEKGVEA